MTGIADDGSRRYVKPVVVPEHLDLLSGPTTGIVVLPRRLKWSGNPTYDLDSPGRIVDLYRTVINEAAVPGDLYSYLDRSTLVALWASMWLPASVRQMWEDRFPELRSRSGTIAA